MNYGHYTATLFLFSPLYPETWSSIQYVVHVYYVTIKITVFDIPYLSRALRFFSILIYQQTYARYSISVSNNCKN
jgi:hypothetical protein